MKKKDRILYALGETINSKFVGCIVTESNKIYSFTILFDAFQRKCNSSIEEYFVFSSSGFGAVTAGWVNSWVFHHYTIKRIRWTKQRKKEFAQFLLGR